MWKILLFTLIAVLLQVEEAENTNTNQLKLSTITQKNVLTDTKTSVRTLNMPKEKYVPTSNVATTVKTSYFMTTTINTSPIPTVSKTSFMIWRTNFPLISTRNIYNWYTLVLNQVKFTQINIKVASSSAILQNKLTTKTAPINQLKSVITTSLKPILMNKIISATMENMIKNGFSKFKNITGAGGINTTRMFTEIAAEMSSLKPKPLQLDLSPNASKNEEKNNSLRPVQMSAQEKESNNNTIPNKDKDSGGPLKNNGTYSVTKQELEKKILEAATKGDVAILRDLIRVGVDINARDHFSNTALKFASEYNHTDIVKVLIGAGAYLDAQNVNSDSALTWATGNNHTEISKLLIDAGADVNLRKKNGATALFPAVWRNNIEVVKMLLEKGAKVNVARDDGYTPLHSTSIYGSAEVAKLLVSHGASLTLKDKIGKTPLSYALSSKNINVANYLKSIGAPE